MSPDLIAILQAIAYLGLIIGLIGAVAPVIPGPTLIWLSALLWAWTDSFEHIGWPTLVALGLLAALGGVSELLFTAAGAKRGGASWQSMAVAGLGAVTGFIIFNLPGALIGAVGGMLLWEARRRQGQWGEAWRASRGVLVGYIASVIVQILVVMLMLTLFVWQAFLT